MGRRRTALRQAPLRGRPTLGISRSSQHEPDRLYALCPERPLLLLRRHHVARFASRATLRRPPQAQAQSRRSCATEMHR